MKAGILSVGLAPACAMASLAMAFVAPVVAKERVEQIPEDSARTRVLSAQPSRSLLTAASADRVCEAGAKWVRLDFRSLKLQSYDSLVLKSSGGDRYVLQGNRWNNRTFSARALRGSCVEIQPYFASSDSSYQLRGYSFGTRALADTTVIVAGAGDICDTDGATCKATSDLITDVIKPNMVFTAGDNAYSNGTLDEYNARYKPSWGRFREITFPTPGNHEYQTTGASGYFDYFNGVLTGTGADRAKGYYSWDLGEWHFVALNTMDGGAVDATQLKWLRDDLAATNKPCTAAYFHHPLISFGYYAPSGTAKYSNETVKPLYDALYAAKADLVLVGHDHNYQRFIKMNPSLQADPQGFVQVLVGTGGRRFYDVPSRTSSLLATSSYSATEKAVSASTHGVLKLTLSASGYTGEFVRATNTNNGQFGSTTRPEKFTGTCNKAGTSGNTAPVANFSTSINGLTVNFTDTSSDADGSIVSRSWSFGDGSTSTLANPPKTYASANTYTVTLTVTDNGGASKSVSKQVTVSGGSTSSQLLLNPGFESTSTVSWSSTSGVITNSTLRTPRTGSFYAWLNGYGSASTDRLSQLVTIPAGRTSATLSFHLKIDTKETQAVAYDTLAIEVLNSAGTVFRPCTSYSNLDKGATYVPRTCNLSAYIGQTVTIRFTGTENSTLQTSFLIDDTALTVQ